MYARICKYPGMDRSLRIRMTLRMRLTPGEELSMAAIDAATELRDRYLGITPQQIHQALVDGQEVRESTVFTSLVFVYLYD